MDYDLLKRDLNKTRSALKQVGNKVIAVKPVSIIIPERFIEKKLSIIGDRCYTIGIYALVSGDIYCVSRVIHQIEISPTAIAFVKYKGLSHVQFEFDAGSTVIPQLETIKDSTMPYTVFDEIILKGKSPWYLSYEDLSLLFNTSDQFAGVNMGSRHAILGMIAAAITRSESDKNIYYRHALSKNPKEKSTVIPLRNVGYGTTNTTSALIGAYWNDGLSSALVNPSDKTEKIEELLTK